MAPQQKTKQAQARLITSRVALQNMSSASHRCTRSDGEMLRCWRIITNDRHHKLCGKAEAMGKRQRLPCASSAKVDQRQHFPPRLSQMTDSDKLVKYFETKYAPYKVEMCEVMYDRHTTRSRIWFS